jgi:muramoyltetrapeptide carboxypeptidase
MRTIYPKKLKKGDQVMVIAPSYSHQKFTKKFESTAVKRFNQLGLKITWGKNLNKCDSFESSSIQNRVEDLHQAFSDKKIKGIITSIGGYNSNFLLKYLDWKLIKENPKFFCGFSDITVLSNAIFKKTGLVTYSGPNFRNFAQKKHFDYTLEYFQKIALKKKPIKLTSSQYWSDDPWTKDQNKRKPIKNKGWLIINQGKFQGQIIGGNLCSLNLLQGTSYFPSIKNTILLIEDDAISSVGEFSRNLQSLLHLQDFQTVKAVLFGRFQKKTKMTNKLLKELVNDLQELRNIPVIANLDFGHTDPKFTFPIGGQVKGSGQNIIITKH